MLGQIYKDFKVSFVPLLCTGMLVLFIVILTFSEGMDAEMMEDSAFIAAWGLFIINLFLPVLAMFTAYDADEKEKWIPYAMTMPGGSAGYVRSKYIFIVILMFLGAAFTHVYSGIYDGFCNAVLLTQFDFLLIMVADGIGMILAAFHFPFVFRFGGQKGNALAGAAIIILLLGYYCYMMFGDLSLLMRDDLEQYMIKWMVKHEEGIIIGVLLLFFVGIAAMIISCRLSIKMFKKGVAVHE